MNARKLLAPTVLITLALTGCSKNSAAPVETSTTIEITTTVAGSTDGTDGGTTVVTEAPAPSGPTTTREVFSMTGLTIADGLTKVSALSNPFYCATSTSLLYRGRDGVVFSSNRSGASGLQILTTGGVSYARKYQFDGAASKFEAWITANAIDEKTLAAAPDNFLTVVSQIAGFDAEKATDVKVAGDNMLEFTYQGKEGAPGPGILSFSDDRGGVMLGLGSGGFTTVCESQNFNAETFEFRVAIPGTTETKLPVITAGAADIKTVSAAEYAKYVG
jgi:hypothetical protein